MKNRTNTRLFPPLSLVSIKRRARNANWLKFKNFRKPSSHKEDNSNAMKRETEALKDIEAAEELTSVRRTSVSVAGLLNVTNLILNMLCMSVAYSSTGKSENGRYDMLLAYFIFRLTTFVLVLSSTIAFTFRTFNVKIILSTALTVVIQFLAFAYGLGITIYIVASDLQNKIDTEITDEFAFFIASYCISLIVVILLVYDYVRTENFRNKGSGLPYQQKLLHFSILLLYGWIIVGAVIFALLENRTLLIGFYFCLVTITTIGYGDVISTTSLSQYVMLVWSLIGLAIMGLYLVNFANFLLSVLDNMKTKRLAMLLKEQLLLRIHTSELLVDGSKNKKELRQFLSRTNDFRFALEFGKNGLHVSTTHDGNAGMNMDPLFFQSNRDVNSKRYFQRGVDEEWGDKTNSSTSTSSSSGNIEKRFTPELDSQTQSTSGGVVPRDVFIKRENIEKNIEELKNSPRFTLRVYFLMVIYTLFCFVLIFVFHFLRGNTMSYSEILWLSFVSYSTIGYGNIVYRSESSIIYFCVTMMFLVSLFGVLLAGVIDFLQTKIKRTIKPEQIDEMEKDDLDKVLTKVGELLKNSG